MLVTRFGVSVENVVATIETPTSHQGAARPDAKNSVVLLLARRKKKRAGRNDTAIEMITTVQSAIVTCMGARCPERETGCAVSCESLESVFEVRGVLTGVHEARNPISDALVIRRVRHAEPLRACRGEHAHTRVARSHLRANGLAQQELRRGLRAARLEEPRELPLQRGQQCGREAP